MAIAKGATLGPYEILTHLGSGGMGEVWRARDRRIGRDVAVKILPEAFATGDERVQRFEQEARAAGALNHPGLVTIFDVGTTEGSPYIVMELLEGQTLRDVIGDPTPAALPIRKAMDYTIQIASALAVAHEKGIVHRDLKPENIFITSDRRVKILDFGLAKLVADTKDADGRYRTPKHLTSAGIALGTPGYMSPEQVRADPVDHRTDIFSLGSVLYEMITGKPAFECFSAVETMAAVLNTEPEPMEKHVANVSPALEAIVRHCLEKDPRERFQSARDLAFQLRTLPEMQGTVTGVRQSLPSVKRLSYRTTGYVLGGLLLLGAGVGGFALWRGRTGPATARTYQQLTFADGLENFPTLAPDGKSFAYVSSHSGNRDIYVQRVDGRTAVNVTIDSTADDSEPAFSPDGSWIAFRSERDGGGIYVMGVTGESVRRLTDMGHNPSWSPDGTRLVVSTQGVELRPHIRETDGELWEIDVRTGARKPLVQEKVGGPDFGRNSDAVQPSWSPHGKRIAFWGVTVPGQRDIWTIDPSAKEPKRTVVKVTKDGALHWNPVWSPDGKYLYFGSDRDGTLNLWRVPMNEESGEPTGDPESLALPASVAGNFSVAQTGELAFTTVTRSFRLIAFPFDASTGALGEPRTLFGGSEEILTFDPSPDGKSVAFTTGGGVQEDLFVANIDGTRVRKLTNDVWRERGVTWSPNGKSLYFYSNRGGGSYHIWRIHADGSGIEPVTNDNDLKRVGARNIYVPSVSPDGRTVAAQSDRASAIIHLGRPIGRRVESFGDLDVRGPRWSSDGTQIVYRTGTESVPEIGIYVPSTRRLETIARGVSPHWLPDSKRVALFDNRSIGILDVATRQRTETPFTPPPGVDFNVVTPRLSKDGSTVYGRQMLEQGDIWLVRFEKRQP